MLSANALDSSSLVARGANLHEADRRGEKVADADHGEHAEHAEQERVAEPFAEHRKDQRRAGQHQEEDDQPRDDARPHVLINDRRRVEFVAGFPRHSPQLPENRDPPG